MLIDSLKLKSIMLKAVLFIVLFATCCCDMVHLPGGQRYSQKDLECFQTYNLTDQIFLDCQEDYYGNFSIAANSTLIYEMTRKGPNLVFTLSKIQPSYDKAALRLANSLKKQIYKSLWIYSVFPNVTGNCEYLTNFADRLSFYTGAKIGMTNYVQNWTWQFGRLYECTEVAIYPLFSLDYLRNARPFGGWYDINVQRMEDLRICNHSTHRVEIKNKPWRINDNDGQKLRSNHDQK